MAKRTRRAFTAAYKADDRGRACAAARRPIEMNGYDDWPCGRARRVHRHRVDMSPVKVAMLIRLSAMTPKPTQRCMPSTPW